MKPLFDLLPAFVFVAVLAWFDEHPVKAAAWSGATFQGPLPLEQAGVREAPVLLATLAALAVLGLHYLAVRWRCRGRGCPPAVLRSFAAMLTLVALLALTATLMSGSPGLAPWLPSALYWTLGLTLWLTRVGLQRNLLRALLGHRIDVGDLAWQRLNAAWVGFFGLLGLLHLWVAYSAPPLAWLQFKVGAGLALLLLFSLMQWAYLARRSRGGDPKRSSPGALGN
jgi:intracellular septation protein